MKALLTRHRFFASTLVLTALAGFAYWPRIVQAFTIAQLAISYDPISVPIDHTLHVNIVNQFGTDPVIVRALVKPTTPGAGSQVFGSSVVLNPGDGTDQDFSFAGFSPPAGALRVPVVCEIFVTLGPGHPLTSITEWSGKLATSLEVVENISGRTASMLGARHVVVFPTHIGGSATFCLDCN